MATSQMVAERGSKQVSCFSVEVELINHSDELFQQLEPERQVRSARVRGPVDSGVACPSYPSRSLTSWVYRIRAKRPKSPGLMAVSSNAG